MAIESQVMNLSIMTCFFYKLPVFGKICIKKGEYAQKKTTAAILQ